MRNFFLILACIIVALFVSPVAFAQHRGVVGGGHAGGHMGGVGGWHGGGYGGHGYGQRGYYVGNPCYQWNGVAWVWICQ